MGSRWMESFRGGYFEDVTGGGSPEGNTGAGEREAWGKVAITGGFARGWDYHCRGEESVGGADKKITIGGCCVAGFSCRLAGGKRNKEFVIIGIIGYDYSG
jgi:hypothetical protein